MNKAQRNAAAAYVSCLRSALVACASDVYEGNREEAMDRLRECAATVDDLSEILGGGTRDDAEETIRVVGALAVGASGAHQLVGWKSDDKVPAYGEMAEIARDMIEETDYVIHRIEFDVPLPRKRTITDVSIVAPEAGEEG